MLNELVVVKTSAFQGEKKADKNGMENIWLTPVAGKIPNQALVISGTVADKAGLQAGQTLLVMINETASDAVYGRQFSHTVLGPVSVGDILPLRKELGAALVLDTKIETEPKEDEKPSMNTSNLNTNKQGKPEKVGP
jgi:ribosomal protein S28E/S33